MIARSPRWPADAICLHPDSLDAAAVAERAYLRTCRSGFDAPGLCVINLGSELDSVRFRRFMVALEERMAAVHETRTGKTLALLSAQRFDQQETTRPHLDGGPEECFLMLGYEPSAVQARVEAFDYARCAFDLGMTPRAFLDQHNPMFRPGSGILQDYAVPVPCFEACDYRVLCINNSTAAYSESRPAWQGVMHTASILEPDDSERRVIDYLVVASVQPDAPETLDRAAIDHFMVTTRIGGRASPDGA